ncbi:EamA family transporter [Rhodobacterales bacterium 59_46_T64]|nr:EamA family transporter [Rhodobacterales bacterium 59_46_T64]
MTHAAAIPHTTGPEILRAALWTSGAIAAFSLMAVAGRILGSTHDTFEIMAYRSLVGFLIVCAILTARGMWGQITTRRLGLHLIRNTAHFTGQNLWFYALAITPLAQVFALEFTTPLWVILLSPLFLGERFTIIKLVCVLLGLVGIWEVTQVGNPFATDSAFQGGAGLIAAAISAIFFATSIITTKKLTTMASVPCIMFYLTGMQALLGLACGLADGTMALPTAQTAPWLILVGAAGLSAHYCLTNALKTAPATIVAPLDFIRLPVIAVLGLVLFGEPITPSLIYGAALIFVANYINIWFETHRKPA